MTKLETTRPKITQNQLTAKLLELAAASPDAVYESEGFGAGYSLGIAAGEVGCLFGQALTELGVSPVFLKQFDNHAQFLTIKNLSEELGIDYNPEWGTVQKLQDRGTKWATAVEVLSD